MLFDFNPFEKYMFSKGSEKSTCWNFDSAGCFTLSVFEEDLKKLDFAIKQIQLIDLCFQPIDFLKTLTEFC